MTDTTTAMRRFRSEQPLTDAVRLALGDVREGSAVADYCFLERWELSPSPGAAAALRVTQIRRANPALAAAVRAELALRAGALSGRPDPVRVQTGSRRISALPPNLA